MTSKPSNRSFATCKPPACSPRPNGPPEKESKMPLPELLAEANQWIDEGLDASTGPECITSSFQSECVVLVHMLIAKRPRIPVLFLDTGYHFPETYEYRDRIAAEWNLNLINLKPELTVAEQETKFGILYQSAPDRC